MNAASTGPRSDRSKSTLFCPECSFESRATAEWIAITNETARQLMCPECGAIVDSRSRSATPVPHPAD